MPITGVYFIPSHPNSSTALAAITERLRSAYPDEELIPLGRWALEQKLMRDTPSLIPASANTQSGKPRYMQFLSLSHYPTHGFIYTSEPPEKPFHPPHAPAGASPSPPPPMAQSQPQFLSLSQSTSNSNSFTASSESSPMIMTILPMPSFGTLFHHFTYACQPFWAHRLTVAVPNGVIYDVGDFRVRVGDVRQTFPTARPRGTVIEIEWRGPTVVDSITNMSAEGVDGQDEDSGIDVKFSIEESDVDAEYVATAALIREFWGRLGVQGAREAILVPGVGNEVKDRLKKLRDEKKNGNEVDMEGADIARQYMEVLRFNR
ncbi:Mediator complex subunit Med20 [Penicillium odoratum]|uniref:Mediator complex subunit Med20 n=1 Tax=Penicillium odoratum TaxID=1167516 RepID=UPI002547D477|nr:Mediator complex subunit Med20 [Penicillium odoratum]KAJ5745192.1 Mediator complex subunit Med20 [Penicillium odoratum]